MRVPHAPGRGCRFRRGSLWSLKDGHEIELALQSARGRERAVARPVVDNHPSIRRPGLGRDRSCGALEVVRLVVDRADHEKPVVGRCHRQ